MHDSIKNLNIIKEQINTKESNVNIIAVSKTFPMSNIEPLLISGHMHFGENKVQEAIEKWTEIRKIKKNFKLHMIGKLQTNKVKFAIPLFDYIHSVDNWKLAQKISQEQEKLKKYLKIFIQVNIGNEDQKSGINKKDLSIFCKKCINELNLKIIGLMCIPPQNEDPKKYFKIMLDLNKSLGFEELSMGMSSDYVDAVKHGATFIRVGSKIFGERS
ncbi:YggS family pyridoxal phosphate-dependent enzyme [Candidatus Pelagibacter sp.]|uniref:YggS family pyridoxal phosphate-dependent enzyme n=1 Tax=Candidatus Pelagibacter sp. TaxID=2024849 RepID=UPI003F8718D8